MIAVTDLYHQSMKHVYGGIDCSFHVNRLASLNCNLQENQLLLMIWWIWSCGKDVASMPTINDYIDGIFEIYGGIVIGRRYIIN